MISRCVKQSADGLFKVLFALSILLMPIACAQQEQAVEEKAAEENEVPAKVRAALEARFPGAEIREWSQEKEGDIVVVDVEFEVDGRKLEADIKEDGTLHNWEQQIPESDLPAAVRNAVASRYPGAALKEIMETRAVREGEDVIEEYEIILATGAARDVEVTLAPDGTFLEDAGSEQSEEPE